MKDIIKKRLDEVYGEEGISKKVAELNLLKDSLILQRDELNSKIRRLNLELKKWSGGEISPNQTSIEF
jgi:hypothetical protein